MFKEKKLFIASIDIFSVIGTLATKMSYVEGTACLFSEVADTVVALLVD